MITGITRWDSKTFVPGNTWAAVKDKCKPGSGHWLSDYKLVTQTDHNSKGHGSVKLNSKGERVEVANDKYFVICKLVKRPEKKAAIKPKADFFKKKAPNAPSKKKEGNK